ncbi:NADP-dependent oxidoreductase [Actinomyces israelii]|uniref:NADP-dependent oxidoreductase n=1 Tax=Actinomyces israelii TaxID=1659 RepID=UPI0005B98132|nr:NADP-dependent oxidoreductase [Actinomyces israelii]
MVRAIEYRSFGGPEVLEMAEVPEPVPGPGQVRVAVRAAGLNPVDWKIVSGMMDGDGPRRPRGVGRDYAGVVDAVGEGVASVAVGDEVLGTVHAAPGSGSGAGTLAERLVVDAGDVVLKPAALSFAQAAALGVAVEAAAGALRALGVHDGDVLVVSAASGGVGSMAVQLAGRAGAAVIGIAGEDSLDRIRSLGAVAVAYGEDLEDRVRAAAPSPVTRLLDCHGPQYVDLALALGLAPEAIATIVPAPPSIAKGVRVTGSRDARPEDLRRAAALVADGTMTVTIARVYPFDVDSVRQAYTELRGGHVRGKLVVDLPETP